MFIHDNGSILTGVCGCVASIILSCRHVLAILHYIENKATLCRNKSCASKKQIWDVWVYRQSEKIHPWTKIGNVSFAQPHSKYKYKKIPRCQLKKSRFDPRSSHDSDVSFFQKGWEEIAKDKGYCQRLPIFFEYFFKYFCHKHLCRLLLFFFRTVFQI